MQQKSSYYIAFSTDTTKVQLNIHFSRLPQHGMEDVSYTTELGNLQAPSIELRAIVSKREFTKRWQDFKMPTGVPSEEHCVAHIPRCPNCPLCCASTIKMDQRNRLTRTADVMLSDLPPSVSKKNRLLAGDLEEGLIRCIISNADIVAYVRDYCSRMTSAAPGSGKDGTLLKALAVYIARNTHCYKVQFFYCDNAREIIADMVALRFLMNHYIALVTSRSYRKCHGFIEATIQSCADTVAIILQHIFTLPSGQMAKADPGLAIEARLYIVNYLNTHPSGLTYETIINDDGIKELHRRRRQKSELDLALSPMGEIGHSRTETRRRRMHPFFSGL